MIEYFCNLCEREMLQDDFHADQEGLCKDCRERMDEPASGRLLDSKSWEPL